MRRREDSQVPAEQILVVDDDESIRQIVRLFLSDEGYEVVDAANGQLALELLETLRPALILLDLRMPVMNGWEFVRRYHASPAPRAPILAFVAALNACQEVGDLDVVGVLTKPFDLDELLTAVRTQLSVVT
jgi:CheY-like chemotaxis protein